jgi:hypothetical protein
MHQNYCNKIFKVTAYEMTARVGLAGRIIGTVFFATAFSSYQVDVGALFPRVRQLEREAGISVSSADVV